MHGRDSCWFELYHDVHPSTPFILEICWLASLARLLVIHATRQTYSASSVVSSLNVNSDKTWCATNITKYHWRIFYIFIYKTARKKETNFHFITSSGQELSVGTIWIFPIDIQCKLNIIMEVTKLGSIQICIVDQISSKFWRFDGFMSIWWTRCEW